MKMIAVGDNVTDCYLDQKIFYPGGNAVNVAVGCRRDGFDEVAYIGVFGDDINAQHIKWALDQEKVTYDRSRTLHAISGRPGVNINEEGDRIFVGGPKHTAQRLVRLQLLDDDLEYIKGFDVCHTSCYSSIEPELPKLAGSCAVSFDFSDRRDPEYLKVVCPYARFAFFSGSDLSEEEIYALADQCHALGTEVVGVTRGSKGALFSWKGQRYAQGIKPVEVVDTMGAGDSFIAGFLTHFTRTGDMVASLDYAADVSAVTCTCHGGFGYPHPFVEE